MTALYFVPPRGAFVDPRTGELSRSAVLFLRGLFERVGGELGPDATDLALMGPQSGAYAATADIDAAAQALSLAPALADPAVQLVMQDFEARQSALEAQVAELTKQMQDLRCNPISS